MTTAAIEQERLSLIHETGYWRIVIRPSVFDADRIPTHTQCWKVVEQANVRLRGWDYPHVDSSERVTEHDWIQSGSAFGGQAELWRFFQSGQFVHHRSCEEDREPPAFGMRTLSPKVRERRLRLDALGALYTVTEVYEFARNLAYGEVLEPVSHITIELHGAAGRTLILPDDFRRGGRSLTSTAGVVSSEFTVLPVVLLATASELALDAAIHIFEQFGWHDPPRDLLAEEQRRLLEHRL